MSTPNTASTTTGSSANTSGTGHDNGNNSNRDNCSSNSVGRQDPASYFLDLSRQSSGTPCAMEEDQQEEEPTELNTINSSGGFLVVSTDKLSIKYTSVNLHGHDVGVVQANKPAPVKRLVYYFEIYVKNAGAKGQIAIGFTNESFKMRRQPGWEANSCGYHGDDGNLYRGQARGEPFGPTFTAKDKVGAGINYASQEFFFTKNGAIIGTVCKIIEGPLFPTVAVHSQNEEVEVNFGQKQFALDLKARFYVTLILSSSPFTYC
uniref:B30.2/SPRY domain-containing protein n=1 Tax=Rhizophora mucronata TaxID=61149 RepID=A0A2P2LW64_RHIMU